VKQVTKPSSCIRHVQYKYETVDFTVASYSVTYISKCPKLYLF